MRLILTTLVLIACGSDTTANPATTASSAKTAAPTVVATWSGGEVSSTTLDESISTELTKLKAEFVNSEHEARQNGLEAIVGEKVLEAEAKKRGLEGVEALLKIEVNDKISAPTEEEVSTLHRLELNASGHPVQS